MSTAPTFTTTLTGGDPDVPRDGYGRPLIPAGTHTWGDNVDVCTKKPTKSSPGAHLPVPHVHCTRATTIAKTLSDTENLSKWRERQVAIGVSQRRDLQLAASTNLDNKAELNRIVEAAKEFAGASNAATIGTALHAMCEKLNRGEDPGYVPDDLRSRLEAYRAAVAGWEWLHLEELTVNTRHGIAGTPDGVARVNGRTRIIDLKTSSSDPQFGAPDWGIQLAIYAGSKLAAIPSGDLTDLPADLDPTTGLIIHLPSTGLCADGSLCQVYRIPLDPQGIALALDVRAWRKRTQAPLKEYDPVQVVAQVVEGPGRWVDLAGAPGMQMHSGTGEARPRPEGAEPTPPPVEPVRTPAPPMPKVTLPDARPVDDLAPATSVPAGWDVVDHPDDVSKAIAGAATVDALKALYRANSSAWAEGHHALAAARMAVLRVGA